MSEPSTDVGVWSDGRTPRRRCTAKSSQTGLPCKRAPIEGGTVCGTHGGRAPHVKRAAKARLENAADRMARWLLDMAADETTPPAVRLAAIKDALDRAGLSPRQALDVVHELKPWEKIMEGLALDGVARGPNGGAAPAVVDGEIVPDGLAEFGDGRSA